MVNVILEMIGVLFISIAVHELGHIVAMRTYLNYWPQVTIENMRIRIGTIYDYQQLTPKQKKGVWLYGVAWGAVVLGFYTSHFPSGAVLFIPYVFASAKDIKNVWKAV